MTITLVQQVAKSAFASTNAVTVTATGVGNLLVLTLLHQATGTVSVNDNGGNTWTQACDTSSAGATSQYKLGIFYCLNANTVTNVTASDTASSELVANVSEWSGAGGFSQSNVAYLTTFTATPAPAQVTASVGDLVVGSLAYFDSANNASVASPYTAMGGGGTATTRGESAYSVAAATGSTGPAWTITGGSNLLGLATASFTPIAPVTPVTTGTTGVSVGLTGTASALAVAAGSLALGLALTGTAVPVAVATGTLPVVAGLTGTASQPTSVTVTGSLPAALSLMGTASIVATTTGALPLTAGLSGAGSVVGSYVTTGNLPLTVALTGTAQTVTTVTGALPVAVGLTGAANVPAVPALTGTLPTALSLSGAANIVALTTGTLPLAVGLSGVGVNPSNEHDVTVTAALDPRPWASSLTTRTNTGLLVQRSWEARLE